MANRNRILYHLLSVLCVLSVVLLGVGPSASAGSAAPKSTAFGQVKTISSRLKTEMKKQGFEVNQGYFQLWAIEDCLDSYAVMGSCFFNNPTAPYVIPVLPYWEDEYVDPSTKGAFGETKPGYGTSFRLDPNEAIVIIGFLPPEAAYFGQQSYLFTRQGGYQTNNDTYRFLEYIGAENIFFHTIPANPERVVLFSSLSDSNNNVVIQRQSGRVWNQLRFFIITPDKRMDKVVRQVLGKLSVAKKDVFTEAIPSNMQFGLDETADEFMTGFRYSMPADGGEPGSASDAWRHNPSMVVLRIRSTRPNWQSQPYPAWEDDSPETRKAVSEAPLQADLDSLVYKVAETWGQPCEDLPCSTRAVVSVDTQSYPFNLVGPKCTEIGMDCQGDTQDASYEFRPGFSFDNDEVYAIVSTLGTATGNATYVSLGVNNIRLRLGAKNVDDTMLIGSTMPDFYPGVNNLDMFYVFYFTRNCEGLEELTHGFCLSVEDSPLVIPYGDLASFVERDYLAVGAQRGPDSAQVLPSRVLRLHRPVP